MAFLKVVLGWKDPREDFRWVPAYIAHGLYKLRLPRKLF